MTAAGFGQEALSDAADMTAVWFDGSFGWLHTPAACRPGRDFAAVLCPPLGSEQRWAHRTIRKLAHRLAGLGIASLRFDWPGTGNSRDQDPGADAVVACQNSVGAAIDWVKERTGTDRVVVIGLRFGALMGTCAVASRTDVAALGLLAPIVSGRTYVRELKAAARVSRHAEPPPGGGIAVDGLDLSDAALATLTRLSLPLPTPGTVQASRPVLVLDTDEDQAQAYTMALRDAGAALTSGHFAGYSALMASAVANRVPYDVIDRVERWIVDAVEQRAVPAVAMRRGLPADGAGRFSTGDIVEEPLRFGAAGALFGILCRPAAGSMPDSAVLIFNTGGDPHYGIGRLGVLVARRLAADGIASLRLDFAGLGDSIYALDEDTAHLFETDRRPDIDAAVETLAGLGVTRFGATGLCAGGYHAFHAALRDERFVSVVPINMTAFMWAAGQIVEDVNRASRRSTAFYRDGLMKAETWRRLLRGQVAVTGILLALAARARSRLLSKAMVLAERATTGLPAPTPRRMVDALSKRGVRLLMLISFEDASMDALTENFGPSGSRLGSLPGMSVQILRDADHNMTTDRMRRGVLAAISRHFTASLRPSPPDAPSL